jgi:ribose 5-phosphate isomerase A
MSIPSQQEQEKATAAQAALKYLIPRLDQHSVIGIGTGSTMRYFIELLAQQAINIKGAIPSSTASRELLKQQHIPVLELNDVTRLPFYIDGADEVDPHLNMIKGGGGALTQEKIIASMADQFIGIADASKQVSRLGKFPLPIEVIPMARSMIARHIVKLGGNPAYRQGFISDNGNLILDLHDMDLSQPLAMEIRLKSWTGVVEVGLFAHRGADLFFLAKGKDIIQLNRSLLNTPR